MRKSIVLVGKIKRSYHWIFGKRKAVFVSLLSFFFCLSHAYFLFLSHDLGWNFIACKNQKNTSKYDDDDTMRCDEDDDVRACTCTTKKCNTHTTITIIIDRHTVEFNFSYGYRMFDMKIATNTFRFHWKLSMLIGHTFSAAITFENMYQYKKKRMWINVLWYWTQSYFFLYFSFVLKVYSLFTSLIHFSILFGCCCCCWNFLRWRKHSPTYSLMVRPNWFASLIFQWIF